MRPTTEIRRARLEQLVAEWGTAQQLADHLGKDRRQISAWRALPPKKGAKAMRDETARLIEQLCNKPPGWLDHEQGEDTVNDSTNVVASSRSVRMDAATIRDAIYVLGLVGEIIGAPRLTGDPNIIKLAYDYILEKNTPVDQSNVLEMTKQLAAKIRGFAGNDEDPKTR